MGLTVAKLFAHRLLDVPWLMHLDVYRKELQPVHGDAKPDLVGKNAAGEWIAIESKGRTHGHDAHAMLCAKEQVESLVSVSGQPVALRVALLAHFEGGILQCAVDDPDEPPRGERPRTNLPLTEKLLFEGYYRPFREWLREQLNARREEVRGQRFVVADTADVDVAVGLREDFATAEAAPVKPATVERTADGDEHAAKEYLGADGILVRLGPLWTVDNMRQEPQARKRS